MCKHLIITGSVAVGKSHIQSLIEGVHPRARVYHEFIYGDPTALEILRRRFTGQVSQLTFQTFILDKWIEETKTAPGDINIYERLPDDAVEFFASSMKPEEYITQQTRLNNLRGLLPSYADMDESNCQWIIYDNVFGKSTARLFSLIEELLKSDVTYIVLEVRSSTAYTNYVKRDRKEEHYTPTEIRNMCSDYDEYLRSKRATIHPKVHEL